jgi:hypothetical protein
MQAVALAWVSTDHMVARESRLTFPGIGGNVL